MINIDEKNVVLNLEASDYKEAIKALVEVMASNGLVELEYYDHVIKREKKFPTGLPTEGIKVAIPHANSQSIITPSFAIGILKRPVDFMNMADPDEKLSVSIVFLIANKDSGDHLKTLQTFMQCFSDEELLDELVATKTEQEVSNIINEYLKNEALEDV